MLRFFLERVTDDGEEKSALSFSPDGSQLAYVRGRGDLYVSGADGKNVKRIIQSWNAGAERVFGYTASEAVGRSITLIIPPERLAEERTILDRVRRRERVEHFETTRVRKDQTQVEVSITISPIRNEQGIVVGA